ncbi:MAG: hypothetical protein ACYCW6_14190 [Candidatus Xenobia bacterium]
MKKIATLLLTLGLVVALMAPALADTFTGYVVDTSCYVGKDKGPTDKDHAECARNCIKSGGGSALLLDSKKMMMLMSKPDDDAESFNKKISTFAGQRVTITGTSHSKGGLTFLEVDKIQAARK